MLSAGPAERDPKLLRHRLSEGQHDLFEVEVDFAAGQPCGRIWLAFPAGMLRLPTEVAVPVDETEKQFDPDWAARLEATVLAAPITVDAVLYRFPARLRDLAAFKPGEFLDLNGLSLATADLELAGRDGVLPVYTGQIGARRFNKAFLVESRADAPVTA